MLRFEYPIYLYLCLPVVVVGLTLVRLVMWRVQRRRYKSLGDSALLREMMPAVSTVRPTVKFSLLVAAVALLCVMLARPQMGSKITSEKRAGIEIMLAIDVSNSMLAQDVVPSRLQKSKLLVENMINNFPDDKLGIVVFAGDAFVQLPITSDYISAKMFLNSINTGMVSTQGTDIGQAVYLAMTSFTSAKIGKAIIVITDGEDHEGGALEAVQAAYKQGINVFILGIGLGQGAPIPMGNGEYLTDRSGNTVMTALNEQMCQELAQAGRGKYIHVDNTSSAQSVLNDYLARLQKGEVDRVLYSEYDEQYYVVGWLVILLLIIEVMVLEVKNPLFKNIRICHGWQERFKSRK